MSAGLCTKYRNTQLKLRAPPTTLTPIERDDLVKNLHFEEEAIKGDYQLNIQGKSVMDFAKGDFNFLVDPDSIRQYTKAYELITEWNLWELLKKETVSDNEQCRLQFLKDMIDRETDRYDSTTVNWILRAMKKIATDGWKAFLATFLPSPAREYSHPVYLSSH